MIRWLTAMVLLAIFGEVRAETTTSPYHGEIQLLDARLAECPQLRDRFLARDFEIDVRARRRLAEACDPLSSYPLSVLLLARPDHNGKDFSSDTRPSTESAVVVRTQGDSSVQPQERRWSLNSLGATGDGGSVLFLARPEAENQVLGTDVELLRWQQAQRESRTLEERLREPAMGVLITGLLKMAASEIESQGGLWMGSQEAGEVALMVLNPARVLAKGIDTVLGSKAVHSAETVIVSRQERQKSPGPPIDLEWNTAYIGFEFRLRFY